MSKKKINVDKFKGSWEPQVFKGLQALKRKFKYEVEYETEKLQYTIVHDYKPDFILTLKDGRKLYVEAKGYWDAADRAKIRHVMAQNPDKDIRMIFQADSKMHKSSPRRYSDFCIRNKIPYAIKEIPEDWFI